VSRLERSYQVRFGGRRPWGGEQGAGAAESRSSTLIGDQQGPTGVTRSCTTPQTRPQTIAMPLAPAQAARGSTAAEGTASNSFQSGQGRVFLGLHRFRRATSWPARGPRATGQSRARRGGEQRPLAQGHARKVVTVISPPKAISFGAEGLPWFRHPLQAILRPPPRRWSRCREEQTLQAAGGAQAASTDARPGGAKSWRSHLLKLQGRAANGRGDAGLPHGPCG